MSTQLNIIENIISDLFEKFKPSSVKYGKNKGDNGHIILVQNDKSLFSNETFSKFIYEAVDLFEKKFSDSYLFFIENENTVSINNPIIEKFRSPISFDSIRIFNSIDTPIYWSHTSVDLICKMEMALLETPGKNRSFSIDHRNVSDESFCFALLKQTPSFFISNARSYSNTSQVKVIN